MFSGLTTAANALSTFSNIYLFKQKKNMVLDPLTSVIRLAIFSFKDDGSKISISNNKISYCEPNVWQGTLRLAFGDNREDLHNLYNPIIRATEWYSCEDESIKTLFELSIKGIEVLRKTYSKNSTIYHTLKLYLDIIQYKIDTNKFKCNNKNEEETDVSKIYSLLKNLWSKRELSIISNLLVELKEKKKKTKEEIIAIFNALDLILSVKENKVRNIILEQSTIL